MMVIKWTGNDSYNVELVAHPIYEGIYKEGNEKIIHWSGKGPDYQTNCFIWNKIRIIGWCHK